MGDNKLVLQWGVNGFENPYGLLYQVSECGRILQLLVVESSCIDSTLAKIGCFFFFFRVRCMVNALYDECDLVLVTRRQEAFGLNVFKPNCGR